MSWRTNIWSLCTGFFFLSLLFAYVYRIYWLNRSLIHTHTHIRIYSVAVVAWHIWMHSQKWQVYWKPSTYTTVCAPLVLRFNHMMMLMMKLAATPKIKWVSNCHIIQQQCGSKIVPHTNLAAVLIELNINYSTCLFRRIRNANRKTFF